MKFMFNKYFRNARRSINADATFVVDAAICAADKNAGPITTASSAIDPVLYACV